MLDPCQSVSYASLSELSPSPNTFSMPMTSKCASPDQTSPLQWRLASNRYLDGSCLSPRHLPCCLSPRHLHRHLQHQLFIPNSHCSCLSFSLLCTTRNKHLSLTDPSSEKLWGPRRFLGLHLRPIHQPFPPAPPPRATT